VAEEWTINYLSIGWMDLLSAIYPLINIAIPIICGEGPRSSQGGCGEMHELVG